MESDLLKKNPLIVFLLAYYHKLKNVSLVDEEGVLPEEQMIDLSFLPAIVAKKWLEKKRRMQLMVDARLGDLTEREVRRKTTMLNAAPESDSARKRRRQSPGQILQSVKGTIAKALAMPTEADFRMPEPPELESNLRLGAEVMNLSPGIYEISLQQLQRLMDSEPMLQILLGTKNAIDVIRHFKLSGREGKKSKKDTSENSDISVGDSDSEMYSATSSSEDEQDIALAKVQSLQEGVFKKVDQLEKSNLSMDRRPVKFVDDLADQLVAGITSVQNDWREQLTSVIAVTKDVAEGLGQILMGINQIEVNTDKLDEMLAEGSSGSEGGHSLSSSSSSEDSGGVSSRPSKGMLGGMRASIMMPRASKVW